MRSIVNLLLVVLGCVAIARAGWQLTFADEFNGQTVLNNTSWQTSYSFAPVIINEELQFYSPGGFTFGSDHLRIVGEKKSVNGFDYQSGLITTNGRFEQTFGYFEIRARWMSGRGLWPAFWLYGQYGSISGATEIDILEALLQNPEIAHLTYHCKDKTGSSTTYVGNELADQSWHTYSVQWTPSIIIWYIDGIERFNTTKCVPNYPMFILANMAIGGSWPGAPNATTPFPAYMDVDYIRAYKYVSSGGVSLTGPGEGLAFTMPTLPTLPTIAFGGSPTITPNNADRGDNVTVTFTFTVRGTAPLVTPMVAMYVQSLMNTTTNLISRTSQLATMAVGTTHTVSYTVTIPETLEDGYYRIVFGVWNNTWTTGVFWQNSIGELGINSIVGGREMPVVPIDSSSPSSSTIPSSSNPSTQTPSTHLNSSASLVAFETIVLLLSFVICTLI